MSRGPLRSDPRDLVRDLEARQRPLSLSARAAEEFGCWLSLVPWQWWVTLTFDPKKLRVPIGEHGALASWSWWLREIRKQLGHRAEFVLVTERHKSGAIHLHALMTGCDDLSYVAMSKLWQAVKGHAAINGYNPQAGRDAANYVAKYVAGGSDFSHPRFSRNLGKCFPVQQDDKLLERFRSAFDVESVSTWQATAGVTRKHALKSTSRDNV